jgi:hypothetical protein
VDVSRAPLIAKRFTPFDPATKMAEAVVSAHYS